MRKGLVWLLPSLALAQANWTMPGETAAAGYNLKVMHNGCRSEACVALVPPPGAAGQGNLMESVDPADLHGQRIRMRAWVRIDQPGPGDRAQLWLRVDRPSRVLGFYDTMGDRPITSPDWRSYEIVGEVAPDAVAVSLGVRSTGKAMVWVDGVAVEKVPPAGAETDAVRDAIAKIYAGVDGAYEAGNVDLIAGVAARGAEVVIGESRQPLAAVLAGVRGQVAKGAKFQSVSAITAIRVTGAEAVVWVNNETTVWMVDRPRTALSVNRDVWVRTAGQWKLKLSTVIAANVPK